MVRYELKIKLLKNHLNTIDLINVQSVKIKMTSKVDVDNLNYPECIFMGSNQMCYICGKQKSLICSGCNDIRPKCSNNIDCVICATPSTDIDDLINRNLQIFKTYLQEMLSVCKKHKISTSLSKTKLETLKEDKEVNVTRIIDNGKTSI